MKQEAQVVSCHMIQVRNDQDLNQGEKDRLMRWRGPLVWNCEWWIQHDIQVPGLGEKQVVVFFLKVGSRGGRAVRGME